MSGHTNDASGVAAKIAAIADAKTLGYAKFGGFGILTAVVKAILCNWMVCLGVVMAMTSKATIGKIVAPGYQFLFSSLKALSNRS
jgi:formate/nitrite transporter FocA (FNT family)